MEILSPACLCICHVPPLPPATALNHNIPTWSTAVALMWAPTFHPQLACLPKNSLDKYHSLCLHSPGLPTVFRFKCRFLPCPGGWDGRESACNAGDLGSIPESGRPHEEENGYPLQYSCLENSVDREAWQAAVHEVTKSQTGLRD